MPELKPFPGKHGKADYCGRSRHFYEDFGHGKRCKDCNHEKGRKIKR